MLSRDVRYVRRGMQARDLVLLATFGAALALGCDRAFEPYVPGERPEQPDLKRIFPEGAERAAQQSPGGAESPPMAGRGAAPVPAGGAEPIEGTIEVAPALEARIPAGAVLFLVARRSDAGPPLAVKRIADPRFPLDFSIGPGDRMIQSMPFAGPIHLSARLDADGNATTRAPGDLQGSAPASHEPGDTGVSIVIDEVL
jgi:hypothetical protein